MFFLRSSCSEGYEHSYVSAESSESSESEFEPGWGGSKKRKKKKKATSQQQFSDFVRMTSRKRGVISYKESSESGDSNSEKAELDGGDGVEGEGGEGMMEVEDNRDCIEKVLKKRIGKVGGVCVCVCVCENFVSCTLTFLATDVSYILYVYNDM